MTRIRALAVILVAVAACEPASSSDRREDVLARYVDAVNRNSVSEALTLHTPDAEFLIPGQNPIRGTEAMRALLQWDSVLESHIRFAPEEWLGDTLVVGPGVERNAWFTGIGVDSILYAPGTRFVFDGDRISGIYPSSLEPESITEFGAKYGAFQAWMATHEPAATSLAPEGLFRYDQGAAEEWLEVLARYRTGEGGP